MDVFHCNACGHLPHLAGIDHRRYFITNCGHIICANCAANGNGGLKDQCSVCHIACKTVEVNQNSNPEIKAYFMDPSSMLADAYKKFGKIANFQKAQTKNFQTLITRMYDVCRRTSAENASLKKDLASSQEENQALKMKIEAIQQDHQSWIGRGSPAGINGGGGDSGGGGRTTFQLSLGHQVISSLGAETPSSRSPAFPGGIFTTENQNRTCSQNFFDTPSGSSVVSSNIGTPFTMRTPCDILPPPPPPPNATPVNRLFRAQSSSGILGGGAQQQSSSYNDRTANRTTPTPGSRTPRDSGFCPAPGAGRPGLNGIIRDAAQSPQLNNGTRTPDLASRLRGLRW